MESNNEIILGIRYWIVQILPPSLISGSPRSPISWLCGYANPVEGMESIGENQTNIPSRFLPIPCRQWAS